MQAESFALIAHDIKNALGSLETELEAMIDEPSPAMAQSAHLHCAALRRRFIQFLTVYGSAEGLKTLSEDESPSELLTSLQRLTQTRRAAPNAVALNIQISTGTNCPLYWYFDRRLVHMALDAAIHNACRFARSEVTLGVRQDADYLVFFIDDDGPGLGAMDPSDSSTGMGTNLCKSVAQAHHCQDRVGHISLHNREQGGARFELWLP